MAAETNKEPIELTERELAIIRGENPDQPDAEQPADEVVEVGDGPGTEASQEGEHAEQGKDAAAGGSTEAAEVAAGSWVTDEHKELAQSYQLQDADLSQFVSADEFRRAMLLFDRGLAATHQAPEAKPEVKAEALPAEAKPAEVKPAVTADELAIDPQKFIDGGYDEQTVKIAKALQREQQAREQLSQEFGTWREAINRAAQEQANRARVDTFHDSVDGMDEKRYGRSVDGNGQIVQLSDALTANRRKLWEAAETIELGIAARAKAAGQEPKVPPQAVLLKRAELLAFSDEIRQEETKKVRETIAAQSRRRRPVAAAKPLPVSATARGKTEPLTLNDYAKDIANNPAVVRVWEQLQDDGVGSK